jgi:amino acid permease
MNQPNPPPTVIVKHGGATNIFFTIVLIVMALGVFGSLASCVGCLACTAIVTHHPRSRR